MVLDESIAGMENQTPVSRSPFWESAPFWGFLSLFATLVCTVLGARMKSLSWLFIAAWFTSIPAVYFLFRDLQERVNRIFWVISGMILVAIALYKIDSVTKPPNLAPVSLVWKTPPPLVTGEPLTDRQLNATASVEGRFVYNPALGATLPVGKNTLSVTFTPSDLSSYSVQTMTEIVEVKALALHAPIDLPNLTFSDSPKFTAQRRRHIQEVIGEFRTYLKNVGFDVSQQVFPIETRPGKNIGMAFVSPGSVYDGKILIGEKSIDDPVAIRTAYAQYYFTTTIGDIRTSTGESALLAMAYERYYLDSYSGKFIGRHLRSMKWSDALWDIRTQFGAKITDKALYVGLQRRNDGMKAADADSYMRNIIILGFDPLLNDLAELKKINDILTTYGLMQPSQ